MRQAIARIDPKNGTHPGLILRRYLADQSDTEKRKALLLLDAARQAATSKLLKSIYEEAFLRWSSSFTDGAGHRSKSVATRGRLIIGLGSESVLETGLRLDHTYGVPIIPGSALKGLASHYCHDVWGQRRNTSAPEENTPFRRGGDYHSLLFGTTEDGGVITFHDAWILPDSLGNALLLDVMTPHHPKWQLDEAPPTDFDSPVPIPFLSVAGSFDVRLSWSGPSSDQAEAWTKLTMQILTEALSEWGVGGKTSSGYGRLVSLGSTRGSQYQPPASAAAPKTVLPKPGGTVPARLLEAKTKSGGWKARHEPSQMTGHIENSGDVPADKKPGDIVELIVASSQSFKYPTPAEQARAQRGLAKQQKAAYSGAPKGGRRP